MIIMVAPYRKGYIKHIAFIHRTNQPFISRCLLHHFQIAFEYTERWIHGFAQAIRTTGCLYPR
jgi:hypothetical protein